jgi:FkbH-like protein
MTKPEHRETGAGDGGDSWRALWADAREIPTYAALQALIRRRRRLMRTTLPPLNRASARIALLGGPTLDGFAEALALALEAAGVSGTYHVAPYGSYASEMLDPESGTVRFRPDVAVVVLTPRDLAEWPAWSAGRDAVRQRVDEACSRLLGLCEALNGRVGCDIVMTNFHALPERPLGAAGIRMPGEPNRFIAAVNTALADRAPTSVHLLDVAGLAAHHGVINWVDPRLWHHAKYPVSHACLPHFARGAAQMIAARFGCAAKCVVLDLDNTLWGGVVGDDGVEALCIGEGDAVGEAHLAFQRYLKALKDRGVMLAVCSKNEAEIACAPFDKRTEMLLCRSDFVAFVANWGPKSANIRDIARSLNIGLDAIVFVDDNPAERAEVRRALPDVRVVELSDDPAHYAALLDGTRWFETLSLSAEDASRTEMYSANREREALLSATTDYDSYLASLEQEAVIGSFEESQLDRIAQLVGKTNQFNLTTLRMSRDELRRAMDDPGCITLSGRLRDRFGDNGLVTVVLARGGGETLEIVLWLMSCRVLKRGMEQLVCNELVKAAREAGYARITGVYRPTPKNSLVRGHYPSLGFRPAGSGPDGETRWTLDIASYRPISVRIRHSGAVRGSPAVADFA